MKFTNGYWRMREGITPYYAEQVHEVEIESDAITVYAPTKKLMGRGDTLNLPLITIRFSSPMENIIRVKIVHHKGVHQPKCPWTARSCRAISYSSPVEDALPSLRASNFCTINRKISETSNVMVAMALIFGVTPRRMDENT